MFEEFNIFSSPLSPNTSITFCLLITVFLYVEAISLSPIFWFSSFIAILFITPLIFAFIVVISFALNTLIHFVGEETLGNLILNKPVIGPLIAGIIGLIPNCASSVVLTQLYIEGVLGLGSLMAGLLAGSGVGILVLFKENTDIKENIKILGLLYALGVVSGIIIELVIRLI